jgi:hypothetical protein
MKRYSSLIAAAIGTVMLVLQQAMTEKSWDLKIVGFSALIAVIGAISVQLKGKGISLGGIIGTVGYNFYTIYSTGHFTVKEFIITSAFAVLALILPSVKPVQDPPKPNQ